MAVLESATNMFPYWGYYQGLKGGGGGTMDNPADDPRAQEFMASVQKYDPNAHWTSEEMGGENGAQTYYHPVWDDTKLPTNAFGTSGFTGSDLNPNDENPMYSSASEFNAGNAQAPMVHAGQVTNRSEANTSNMIDPNRVFGSNHYGYQGEPANYKVPFDWLGTIGPMIPMLLAGGAGLLATGSWMGGGAGQLASGLAQAGPRVAQGISSGNYAGAAGSAAPVLSSGLQSFFGGGG